MPIAQVWWVEKKTSCQQSSSQKLTRQNYNIYDRVWTRSLFHLLRQESSSFRLLLLKPEPDPDWDCTGHCKFRCCNFVEYLSRNSNKNHESAQNCYYRLLLNPDCHPAFPRVLPFIFNVFSGSSNWPTFARKIWPEWKFQFSSMCISSLPPVMIWMWHKLPHVCQEYLAEMKISSSQCAFPLSLQFPRVIWMWHKCETCYFLAKYIFLEKAQNNRLWSCNDWLGTTQLYNTPPIPRGSPKSPFSAIPTSGFWRIIGVS